MANRGRPKGSKNKPKTSTPVATPKKRGRPPGSKNKPKTAEVPAVIEEKPKELTPEQKRAVTEYDLNLHIYRLLMQEPFFAAISRQVQKISSKSLPTAGVTVDPVSCNYVLYYNPEFFAVTLKNDTERLAVLKHEFYHLILEHVTSRKPADKKENKLWNIAADLAINSFLLQEIPQFCCIPGNGFFKDMPALQSSEWYFNELKKKQQEQKKNGKGGEGGEGDPDGSEGQFDDHSLWDELSDKEKEVVKEIAKEKLRHMMRKAVKEVTQNGNNWGTVSAEMKQDIMRRLEGMVDWKKVLRWFVKVSQRADKSNSIRRINKRYAYIHPGKRVNRQANIAVSIDQSGSVSDDLLCAFFAQLNTLADIATFTVIPFDSSVIEHEVFVWKKKENKAWKRVACGGTDFNAPTCYVNERGKFDGHIILTDLCAPKPRPSKCQRMWMTSREDAAQPYFQTNERIVAIEVKEEN